MPLTDLQCRNAKPSEKIQKLSDGGGLTLVVKPNGTKLFQYRFRLNGIEGTYSIGIYPDTSLASAREQMKAAKALVKTGLNPTHERQAKRLANSLEKGRTFEVVARQWLAIKQKTWAKSTFTQAEHIFKHDVFPKIGDQAIRDIKPPHIHKLVTGVQDRGAATIATWILQWIRAIFDYAAANLMVESNPAYVLRGAVQKPPPKRKQPLNRKQIAMLDERLAAYQGKPETVIAIKMLLLTFVRAAELRRSQWSEFDLEAKVWRIPAEKMKRREPLIVPLSKQVVSLLEQLKPLTGGNIGGYLFPNQNDPKRCIPPTTINRALEYLGFAGKDVEENFSGHGFRRTAATMLNEMGFRADVIERQLAHIERNATRAAYNRADYLHERTLMMQQWADMVDQFCQPSNVITISRK